MLKRIQALPKRQQHIYSIIFCIICMVTAVAITSLYDYTDNSHSTNIALVFILFLVVVSYNTTGYIYGIIYSLFSVVWINYQYTYPFFKVNFTLAGYPVTFFVMTAIAIIISTLTSHLMIQYNLIAEREKELVEAQAEKNRANLLRAISHDLRTPLSGIIGHTLVYRENNETLSEEEKLAIIDSIHDDAFWLVNMVENLLTITRIREDDLTIKTSVESVEEIVGASVRKIKKRRPDCQVRVTIPENLIFLSMDAILIEQVILNLLENALNHSGSTKPIDFVVEEHPDNVSFTIRDYGKGIPKEMLDNLFDGTVYTAPHAADARKGMGIGLVICKTIITAHQGTIEGKNHRNGAEFTFTLSKHKEDVIS